MRREQPGTHAAHREQEHQNPPAHAVEEPRKRSYERVIDGEEAFPDDLTDGLTAEGLPIETVEAESDEIATTRSTRIGSQRAPRTPAKEKNKPPNVESMPTTCGYRWIKNESWRTIRASKGKVPEIRRRW